METVLDRSDVQSGSFEIFQEFVTLLLGFLQLSEKVGEFFGVLVVGHDLENARLQECHPNERLRNLYKFVIVFVGQLGFEGSH